VKYVGIIFDEHLTFSNHIKLMNAKLKRANNLLAISRHYLPKELLIQIYYGQFYSHLTYGCQLWGQNQEQIYQTMTLQKKAVRLMTFSYHLAHSNNLFKELKVLKLTDIISLHNILFTHNALNNKTPAIFKEYFKSKQTFYRQFSQNSKFSIPKGSLEIPKYKTKPGQLSIKFICSTEWNQIHRQLSINHFEKYSENENWLQSLSQNSLKHLLKLHFLESY